MKAYGKIEPRRKVTSAKTIHAEASIVLSLITRIRKAPGAQHITKRDAFHRL